MILYQVTKTFGKLGNKREGFYGKYFMYEFCILNATKTDCYMCSFADKRKYFLVSKEEVKRIL